MSFLAKLFGKEKDKLHNKFLYSPVDYSVFFTHTQYNGTELELLELGDLHLLTGRIVACDPLVFLGDWKIFSKSVKPGKYPVTVCVAKTAQSGDRYAIVQVKFSDSIPTRWEMALTTEQNPSELKQDGDYFGYPVDAGLGCFCDEESQTLYKEFDKQFYDSHPEGNIYDDFFADEFKKNAVNPDDPRDIGDWLNFYIPGTENRNVIMFHSGYGDGYYPCYWGVDNSNKICSLIVDFMVFDFG
ncbi:DUF4241 domain-containing protein [Desulfitobacterium sp. Sab5]|uniref:DUF4241 domain-containing protein n=1 Tax=Desulfitobacterium nosdiversum TaxID=3375356 RepID=UPI003CF3AAEB